MSNYHNNNYYGYESKRTDKYSVENWMRMNPDNYEIYISNSDYSEWLKTNTLKEDAKGIVIIKKIVHKCDWTEFGTAVNHREKEIKEKYLISINQFGSYSLLKEIEIEEVFFKKFHLLIKVENDKTIINELKTNKDKKIKIVV